MLPITFIPLLAGDLARTASNALGDIDQGGLDGSCGGRLRHALLPVLCCAGDTAVLTLTTFTKQAFVS
jgi:hypothetical protein